MVPLEHITAGFFEDMISVHGGVAPSPLHLLGG